MEEEGCERMYLDAPTSHDCYPAFGNQQVCIDSVQSQITVVDFSVDRLETHELTNSTLAEFLAKPREEWVTCRW